MIRMADKYPLRLHSATRYTTLRYRESKSIVTNTTTLRYKRASFKLKSTSPPQPIKSLSDPLNIRASRQRYLQGDGANVGTGEGSGHEKRQQGTGQRGEAEGGERGGLSLGVYADDSPTSREERKKRRGRVEDGVFI